MKHFKLYKLTILLTGITVTAAAEFGYSASTSEA